MFRWVDRLLRRPVELDISEAYSRWAASYPPLAHNPLMRLEETAVFGLIPEIRGKRALDLACGTGRYSRLLQQRGASQVVGLDLSSSMLDRAREVTPFLVKAEMPHLCFSSSTFPLVICALAVGHLKDLGRVMKEIGRVLDHGGVVIYSDFHPLGSWMGWKRTFRAADGRAYRVPHYLHFFSDHVNACTLAGLKIENVCEPCIDFESKWRGYPALLVIRATKSD